MGVGGGTKRSSKHLASDGWDVRLEREARNRQVLKRTPVR